MEAVSTLVWFLNKRFFPRSNLDLRQSRRNRYYLPASCLKVCILLRVHVDAVCVECCSHWLMIWSRCRKCLPSVSCLGKCPSWRPVPSALFTGVNQKRHQHCGSGTSSPYKNICFLANTLGTGAEMLIHLLSHIFQQLNLPWRQLKSSRRLGWTVVKQRNIKDYLLITYYYYIYMRRWWFAL